MQAYKTFYSILAGILSFLFAPYGLEIPWEAVIINMPWSLIFPIAIATAYGWRYAILTAISGGVLFPFYLWADNGWPNIGTAVVYLFYMLCLSLFFQPKVIKLFPNKYWRISVLQLPGIMILFVYYYYVFSTLIDANPPFWSTKTITFMERQIYEGFFIKDAANFIALSFIAFSIIELPIGKKLLRLDCTNCENEKQAVFFYSLLVSFLIWIVFLLLSKSMLSDYQTANDEHIELSFMVIMTSGFIVGHILYSNYTNLSQVQGELKQSEAKYRFLSENASVGVSLIENDKVVYISQGYLNMLGYQENEMMNINLDQIYSFIHPDDIENIQSELKKARLEKIKNFSYSYRAKSKQGKYIWVEDNITSEYDQTGKRIKSIIHSHDITEKKEAELLIKMQFNELKKLSADKSRFMQILAHDLRSPFNSLIGFSELLVKNVHHYDIEKIKRHIEIINEISHRSFQLLNDLLLWAQAQEGKLPFEPRNLFLQALVSSIVDEFHIQITTKNLMVENCIPNDTEIFADESMLKSIIRNFLSNAIKFTPQEGKIYFDAQKIENFIEVCVADSGVGIANDDIEKLWDMTQIYSSMGTEGEKGTGLGLMLCKEFIEKHNGKLRVESCVGKGSKFYFSLPQKIN